MVKVRTVVSFLIGAALMAAMGFTSAPDGKKIDIGDQFAFAGLESAKLVPAWAREVSETQIPNRSMNKPICDIAYFYTGDNAEVITVDQLNEYFATVYEAVKAAAADGKIYEKPYMGDTKLGNELAGPKKNKKKSTGRMSCLYKNNGTWFVIDVEHDTQSAKFKKEYPEPYYGFRVSVREYFIDE